jgi:uncharacterized phage-associated protein
MGNQLLGVQKIADYLVKNVDEENGDNITNLKLQKLLYYAQGFHLAMQNGTPLFRENIVAWPHGPAVIPVWKKHKGCSFNPIAASSEFNEEDYAPEVRELLDAIYSTYGQFTAPKLRDMTHVEPPWLETKQKSVIALALMTQYFSTLVEAARNGEEVPGHPPWPINSFRFQRRTEISARMDVHREKLRAIRLRRVARADA